MPEGGFKVVIEGFTNASITKPKDVENWLLPFGGLKCVQIYRLKTVVEFETQEIADKVIEKQDQQLFLSNHLVVRKLEPWDLMVAGDLVTTYIPTTKSDVMPLSSTSNSFVDSENKGSEQNDADTKELEDKKLDLQIEEIKKLLVQSRFIDTKELLTLYNALEALMVLKGATLKPKSVLYDRPWLDTICGELFVKRNETMKLYDQHPTRNNRQKFMDLDSEFTQASKICEDQWLSLVDQEREACNRPIRQTNDPILYTNMEYMKNVTDQMYYLNQNPSYQGNYPMQYYYPY